MTPSGKPGGPDTAKHQGLHELRKEVSQMDTSTNTIDGTTLAATLQRVAAIFTEHPGLPLPLVTVYPHRPDEADLDWFLHVNERGDADQQRSGVLAIISTLGGTWEKKFSNEEATFSQDRDGLRLRVVAVRQAVCTRRVVGTETVTLPAVEAQPERVVERDIVEWDCRPILAEQVSA